MRSTLLRVVAAVGLLCSLQATTARAIPAPGERLDGTPSEWYWLHDVTPQQVTDLIDDTGARLIDIEVQSADPLRFSAAFVQNEGVHQVSGWWWYYGADFTDVGNLLDTNQARLIDIERYADDRFAVIMVNNTGAEQKAWWWYTSRTVSQMSSLLDQNGARLIDVESRGTAGGTLYDGIMVENTGDDASGWYWWLNVDEAFVTAQIQETGYRVVDLDVVGTGDGTRFDVIMMPPESNWWWYYGFTASGVTDLVNQTGSRIVDIEPYATVSGTRYAVALTNNANALTTRLAEELGYGSDGTTGLYLRQLNGPTLASLNPDFRFEPASTIKIFHHFHAWRMIATGVDQTNSLIAYDETIIGNSCPAGGSPTVARSLYDTTRLMMWYSDNPATEAIRARYGEFDIMNSVRTFGGVSTDSDLNHAPLGCGTQAVAAPNELTLRDAGNLYEQIVNGAALSTVRTGFYETMQSHLTPETDQWWLTDQIQQMVVDEANAAGVSYLAGDYLDQMEWAWKPGGYTLNGKEFVSVAGTIQIPECVRARFSDRDYVFGLFLHDAIDTQRLFDVTQELFRDLVREGLESCATSTSAPSATVASALTLENAVPNPFNPRTQIRFGLAEAGPVRVDVIDPRGRVVATLAHGHHAAGEHAVTWNGRDTNGASVSSGVYFVKATGAGEVRTRKITLLK